MFKKLIFMMMGLLFLCNYVNALSTENVDSLIDLDRDNNVILNYYYDDYELNGLNVDIYYVASIDEEIQYHLSSEFMNYPIAVNGIKFQDEWKILEDTLESYIIADDIIADYSVMVSGNRIQLDGLKSGLYFVKTDMLDNDNYSLLFESFFINLPGIDNDGNWNYDVSVYPKAEEFNKKYEKINYSVIKEWVDDGIDRPLSVDIEIYRDGDLFCSQVLSNDNNWNYQWEVADDSSIWTVVERNVDDGYNVSILKRDNKFIVVNIDSDYEEENPQTLDNINLYFIFFVISLIGIGIMMVIMFIRNRKMR